VTRLIGVGLLVAFTLSPVVVDAQQSGMPRIGYLGAGGPRADNPNTMAFRQGLRDLGWVEGQTVAIEYRWAEGHPERRRSWVEPTS